MRSDDAPETSPAADCAWCGEDFDNIVDLLVHVEDDHLANATLPAA